MFSKSQLEEEEKKMRRLRILIDLVSTLISRPETSILEAYGLMHYARNEALHMFPGKEFVFDLLYLSRFRRILEEKLRHTITLLN